MIYFFMKKTFLQIFLGIHIVCIITNSFNTMFYTDYPLQYRYISNLGKLIVENGHGIFLLEKKNNR